MGRESDKPADRKENRLLAALQPEEYRRLVAQTELIAFAIRDQIYRPNAEINHVYFPLSGVLSKVLVTVEGRAVEVAAVGREGMVGLAASLGGQKSTWEVMCQVPCEARRMSKRAFVAELGRGGQLPAVIQSYVRGILNYSGRLIACNCLHTVQSRCARWLLATRDRVGQDSFPLTQEFLSIMLGVRRASVTVAARTLQKAGLIAYRHGQITILDPDRLEAVACECYRPMQLELETR